MRKLRLGEVNFHTAVRKRESRTVKIRVRASELERQACPAPGMAPQRRPEAVAAASVQTPGEQLS